MLGQATSLLDPIPRRWLTRHFGILRTNVRQTWSALWPYLRAHSDQPIHLLDAGCGHGLWSLELALRHPQWQISAIDKDRAALARGQQAKDKLGVTNVQFAVEEFLAYEPGDQFDIVLSVGSAHYLVSAGQGDALFGRFHDWLRPGGLLMLMGPRKRDEVPFSPRLPFPQWHNVFSETELRLLCDTNGLDVVSLQGRIGRWGTMAKQLSWLPGIMNLFTYPLQLMLNALDMRWDVSGHKTSAWVLIARRR